MLAIPDKTVASKKIGSEDIIMINLPVDRFRNSIPAHYDPKADKKSRYQVALLAQACEGNTFDNYEAGRTNELHFWLRVASSNPGAPVKGAQIMLPSMHWLSLASITSNDTARSYLQSFGFNPLDLERINLRRHGGSLAFPDRGRIEWAIAGASERSACIGVNHVIFVATDGPDAVGHRVAALLTDAVMEQPGKIHIQTVALEPFMLKGESFPAAIHRVPKLEADVVWRLHPK